MTARQGSFSGVPRNGLLWAAAFAAVSLAYFAVFELTRDQSLSLTFQAVVRNMISLALTVAIARAILVRWCLHLTDLRFWAVQIGMAVSFTFLWAWFLNLIQALLGSGSVFQFTVSPVLAGMALTWQLLQGLFVYVAVAAITLLERRPHSAIVVLNNADVERQSHYLVKSEDELVSLSVMDIASITGADDYSELNSLNGNRLVATSLAEFERLLDPQQFVRVHRSAIVNLHNVQRAEPAGGGRMILRMRHGPDIAVSRAGARLLRQHAL